MAGKSLLPLLGHSSRHTPFSSSSAKHDPRDFAPPCGHDSLCAHGRLTAWYLSTQFKLENLPTSTRGQISVLAARAFVSLTSDYVLRDGDRG
jgi:hypothetical protein